MGHHEIGICLFQIIERRSFGEDASDKLMIQFHIGLLVRCTGVAVIYGCSAIPLRVKLNSSWIGELRAIVRQDDGKQFSKTVDAERIIQCVKYSHGRDVEKLNGFNTLEEISSCITK